MNVRKMFTHHYILKPGCGRKRGFISPKGIAFRNSIPKGLRLKAQGCERRATLGKSTEEFSTPTGLWLIDTDLHAGNAASTPLGLWNFEQRFPRVARSSQPWAGGHNPFGIEDRVKSAFPLALFIDSI